jgi:hypothetical protein
MSYRNDQDTANARVEALARENRQLVAENARLRVVARALWTAQQDVHPATLWIVGIFAVFTAVVGAAVIAGP